VAVFFFGFLARNPPECPFPLFSDGDQRFSHFVKLLETAFLPKSDPSSLHSFTPKKNPSLGFLLPKKNSSGLSPKRVFSTATFDPPFLMDFSLLIGTPTSCLILCAVSAVLIGAARPHWCRKAGNFSVPDDALGP